MHYRKNASVNGEIVRVIGIARNRTGEMFSEGENRDFERTFSDLFYGGDLRSRGKSRPGMAATSIAVDRKDSAHISIIPWLGLQSSRSRTMPEFPKISAS